MTADTTIPVDLEGIEALLLEATEGPIDTYRYGDLP